MKPPTCIVAACMVAGMSSGFAAEKLAKADDPAFIAKAARDIDVHIASWYKKQKLEVPQVTDDATFLRRVFLVAIGRIPTGEEARAFLEIDDPAKRVQVIDYLMQSKGYSSNMTNWVFDLLRVTDGRPGFQGNFEPYRNWVRTAMENNMPWDDFTNSLLASAGDGWDPQTAAVGYYTRDRGMPLDNLANSMRVFLGSRMECAQCHDDPFGSTERHEFYELAAFTEGQGSVRQNHMRKLWDEVGEAERRNTVDYEVAQVMWDGVYGLSLAGGGAGKIELPSDYQYRDGEPGEMIGAKTPFGKTVRISDKQEKADGRKQLAEWVTTKTGEQYASVAANRMWKRVMGRGVYEPVDEYKETKALHHPELMRTLVELMVELDYDLRAFQKVLLNTKTFQFVPNPQPSKVPGGDDFHGRQLTRLSAEQLWDSLITLAAGDPDKIPRRSLDDRIYVNGKPVLVGKKTMVQVSKEVLALDSEQGVRDYFNKLLSEVKSGGGASASSSDGMMSMNAKINRYGKDSAVRASELPSPAPREHLLYLFGQSDRVVVDGSSREPNVGQVLSLMNGYVQTQLVNNTGAALYKSLEGATTDEEKIRRLYVTILNRPPSTEEMGWMKEEMVKSKDNGLRNIVSALVMSSEFLFLQ
ncbi:DUF1549 and DUF1553 domain-containing protein [Luteolibacter sp. GHJ8]|uniref:DUF1549 and DUF1553 domain-containing protein n=1 Tax=Luteolibacter rhizosphaerae TaxID=2989719 RepID=A0ABT3FXJ6_9BACT|nr:DUF1549 and DUF1553 domain-containing protein [Luteolibacter rhizosphaerae]MCW1912298.1 DUF1549 and DUF1553 domain-containing protein [Luteolibacter rhizosphaerae]